MAETDTNPAPMHDADIVPPTADAKPAPATPLKNAGDAATATKAAVSSTADAVTDAAKPAIADAKQQVTASVGTITDQAADKARFFVEQGKDKVTGLLDQVVQLLTEAGDQVDDKLGAQYGDYARNAAEQVVGFADAVKAKDADALVDDARELVRKSPGIAVGVAATLGFVVARLVQAGIEAGQAPVRS